MCLAHRPQRSDAGEALRSPSQALRSHKAVALPQHGTPDFTLLVVKMQAISQVKLFYWVMWIGCVLFFFSQKNAHFWASSARRYYFQRLRIPPKILGARQVIGSFKLRKESVCILFAKEQVKIYFTDETPKLTIIHQHIIGYRTIFMCTVAFQ